jgi:hypothetical protein
MILIRRKDQTPPEPLNNLSDISVAPTARERSRGSAQPSAPRGSRPAQAARDSTDQSSPSEPEPTRRPYTLEDLRWAHPRRPRTREAIRAAVDYDHQEGRTAVSCTRDTLYAIDIQDRAERIWRMTGESMDYLPSQHQILAAAPAATDAYVEDVIRLNRQTNDSRHRDRGGR